MKRFGLFLCFGLASVALSCTKEYVSGLPPDSGREVELTVKAVTGGTRADDLDFERKVESVQIFVFSDGKLEAVGYSKSDDVTLRIREGAKDIRVIANYPEIEVTSDLTTEALENIVLVMEKEENWNVMVGSKSERVRGVLPQGDSGAESLSSESDNSSHFVLSSTIGITVTRIAARIVLRTVKNCSEFLRGQLNVQRVYITNVVGDAKLSAVSSNYSYEPEYWYNNLGYDENSPSLFSPEVIDVSVEQGDEIQCDKYFYCYPNPTEEDYGHLVKRHGFIPRFTRLVMEAEYTGTMWYYIATIDGVESNHSYEVYWEISGHGEADPEGMADDQKDGEGEAAGQSSTKACDDGIVVISSRGGRAEVRDCVL